MKLNHAFKMMFIGLFVLANDSVGEESRFATFPDQHTIALWLFDEATYPYATLCDAGPYYYDLRLMSKGMLGPGKYGSALYLNGENGYNVSYAGFAGKVVNEHIREEDGKISGLWGPTEGPEYLLQTLNSGQWTCEFWLQLAENPSGSFLIDLGQGYKEGFSLLFTTSGDIELIIAYSGLKAICPTEISDLMDGKWHHLTFIQKGKNVYHFLDGIKQPVVDIDNKVFLYIPEGYGSEEGRTHLYISEDGLQFTKSAASPIFDNLPLYGTFFKDLNPNINDEEQYKLTSWIGNRGIHLFLSPDGIHWRRNETTMLSLVSGGGAESYYDDQVGYYFCNIRRDASFNTESCPGGVRQCILFQTQEPLNDYLAQDCDRIADNTNQIVRWKGHSDLSTLSGVPLRLQFKLENSKLYSFKLEGIEL